MAHIGRYIDTTGFGHHATFAERGAVRARVDCASEMQRKPCLTTPNVRVTFGNVKLRGANTSGVPRAATVGAICVVVGFGLGTNAQAATDASLSASLSASHQRDRAALTLTIHFSTSEPGGTPTPLRRAVLQLPAGLSLSIPQLRSCAPALLVSRGERGCPTRSAIGVGHALVRGEVGTKVLTAPVTLHAFLGPPHNLQPTFEIFGEGLQPIATQMLLTATASPSHPPYGEELVMSVPPITSVPGAPLASVVAFSLTIGGPAAGGAASVHVPAHCPAHGLPFAADFTYADGSSGSALTVVPCSSGTTSR